MEELIKKYEAERDEKIESLKKDYEAKIKGNR